MTGGEDHALAACFPEVDQVPEGWSIVGSTRGAGEDEDFRVLVDGRVWEGQTGWDHFGGRR